ncbi:hypothetical protein KA005_83645 [bacterium]|nr:hypothetical protein [bacterium]
MVIDAIASKKYNWKPDVIEGDNERIFAPNYSVTAEAVPVVESFRTKFADLPTFGIWADRKESDDELLKELGSGWRGFATE